MSDRVSLDELNNAINDCKNKMAGTRTINYNSLKYASQEFMKIADFKKKPIFVKYYTHEEAIGIVLDFFKSLGIKEWYSEARSILLCLNKNTGINMFNYEEVSDLEATDKNGIKLYSMYSGIETRVSDEDERIVKTHDPKSLIRISKNYRFLEYNEAFSKDKITLEDIQTIIHEISHSFDISNSTENMTKRNMVAEITPFCFEKMFDQYLLNKGIVSRKIIDSMNAGRSQDIMYHARYVYTVMNLYQIQNKDGKITKEGIDRFLKEKDIHNIGYVRECLMDVINSSHDLDYHVRYMIAGLASAMYSKHFKRNRKKSIKKLNAYCKCIKEGILNDKTFKLIGFGHGYKEIRKAIDEFEFYYKGSR